MTSFIKESRYRRQPDIAAVDADGVTRLSKQLRLVEPVPGKFLHVIADKDRVDHLGYKYYKQPRRWWHICDANPAFMSPQALLGKDAIAEILIPVRVTGALPDWAPLLATLRARLGVESAQLEQRRTLVVETQIVDGELVDVTVEHTSHAVRVIYNRLSEGVDAIAGAITAPGLVVETPQAIGRIGKSVVIPPDPTGARS